MPDDVETPEERRFRLYDEGCAEFRRTDPEARALAIVNCKLCDDDGYRGLVVCDHVDRTDSVRRGVAACRAALEAKQLTLDEAD